MGVRPVRSGLRETLVMELWEGEERRCDHRCECRWGPCPLAGMAPKASAVEENEDEDAANGDAPDAVKQDDMKAAEALARDAPAALGATAFDGLAFFPRVGLLMAQSERLAASPNVEIVFEDLAPVATVRALRDIKRGEPLMTSGYDEDDDDDMLDEEMESESEDQDEPE